MRDDAGLAGAGAGEDEQRAAGVEHRLALGGVQGVEEVHAADRSTEDRRQKPEDKNVRQRVMNQERSSVRRCGDIADFVLSLPSVYCLLSSTPPSRSSRGSSAGRRPPRGAPRCGTRAAGAAGRRPRARAGGARSGSVIRKSVAGLSRSRMPSSPPFVTAMTDAAARLDLLDVAEHLLEHVVARGDGHDGHVLVDERDGAVLHLAGGIALGVDVGDLLQLERALEGDGVVDAAAQVEEVARAGRSSSRSPRRRRTP